MDKYINTDEVGEDFYSAILDILCEDENNDRANEIIDEFNILPAADVAPVKHGRWIIFEIWCGDGKERKYYRCSECYKANAIRSNFCPNCGADMSNT